MAKLFLSHSHANNTKALALAKWLEENGWDDYFLDISESQGLLPGEQWQSALKAAAQRCEAVIVLISQSWLDSDWCKAEFLLAHSLGKYIFGVLIEDVPFSSLPSEMTSEWQICNLVKGATFVSIEIQRDPIVQRTIVDFARNGLRELRTGLRKAGLDASSFPWPPKNDPHRSPYRGLKPFLQEDAAVFFGRNSAVIQGLDQLRQMREQSIDKLLIILGASGAGKSSFARAGLWPRLQRDDRHFFSLPVIRPNRAAITGHEGLSNCLQQSLVASDIKCTRAQIRNNLKETEGFLQLIEKLYSARKKDLGSNAPNQTLILCIDQFEELYSGQNKSESELLRKQLGQILVRPGSNNIASVIPGFNLIVVVTIRTDLYMHLQEDQYFIGVGKRFLDLTPMDRTEYKMVIEGPAHCQRNAGMPLAIDPRLTEQLLIDSQGPDALPLLAFTLERLFAEYGGNTTLQLDEYNDMGGINGVMETAVTQALAYPDDPPIIPSDREKQKQLLRAAFIPWLAAIDERTSERQRRIARWHELPKETHALVERFIDMRLLTSDMRVDETNNKIGVVIEVAHEAVLRRWTLLEQWLDDDEENLKIANSILHAADSWITKKQSGENDKEWLIHSGGRLFEAEKLLEKQAFKKRMGETGCLYISRCRQIENDLLQQEKRQIEENNAHQKEIAVAQAKTEIQQRRTTFALLLLFFALICTGGWTLYKTRETNRQKSLVMASTSLQEFKTGNGNRALRYGILAAKDSWISPTVPLAELALASATTKANVIHTLQGHKGIIGFCSFSPNGKLVVTTGWDDNTARLWDAKTGSQIGNGLKHMGRVFLGVFSPDNSRVVTVGKDFSARLWDTSNGLQIGNDLKHDNTVNYADFNANGTLIVTAGDDNAARLWDAIKGTSRGNILKHQGKVYRALFSPDGRLVITASEDSTARIWDADSGIQVGKDLVHEKRVLRAEFSPDGRKAVTASEDGTARIWDVKSGTQIGNTLQHDKGVFRASFSPRGDRVLTVSWDDTTRIWSTKNNLQIGNVMEHDGGISYAGFSPDGRRLLTVSHGNTIRLWNALSGAQVGEDIIYGSFVESVNHATFSPDSKYLLTVSDDKTARLFYTSDGTQVGGNMDHPNKVYHADFSPDGSHFLTSSVDEARIWEIKNGSLNGKVLQHYGAVKYAVFSPDGSRLAIANGNRIHLWDTQKGSLISKNVLRSGRISHLDFNPSGSQLITVSSDKTVRLWNTQPLRQGKIYLQLKESVGRAFFGPKGKRILTIGNSKARLWDNNGIQIGEELFFRRQINHIDLNPDRTSGIVATNDKNAILFEMKNGLKIIKKLKHDSAVYHAEFSSDGKTIVTTSWDKTARIWDSSSGLQIGNPLKHPRAVRNAAFNPDGTLIVTAGDDNSVRLWDLKSGLQIGDDIKHEDWVSFVYFSPDGTRILAESHASLSIWDANTSRQLGNSLKLRDNPSFVKFSPTGKHIISFYGNESNTADLWDVKFLNHYHGEDLVRAVCTKWSVNVTTLTEEDIRIAPILKGQHGEDVCDGYR